MKTIEEKATEYAVRITIDYRHDKDVEFDLVQSAALGKECRDAYLAGATEALKSQWRSVEDELPEIRQRVLICLKERNATRTSIVISKRIPFASDNPHNPKWEWSNVKEEDVIAWMPLPEPPKDESHV